MSGKIVHIKREDYDIYIGRPSKWGNKWSHKDNTIAQYKVETREEAIEKYREWIVTTDLMNDLEELRDKVLGCWCAGKEPLSTEDTPFKCHGQVLLDLIEKID